MTIGQEAKLGEDTDLIIPELENLSGRFGELDGSSLSGVPITNDSGFKDIIPGLEVTSSESIDIGFFIGSGGVLSLLPSLPIDLVMVVDKSRSVLELSKLMVKLAKTENSPELVLARLGSSELLEREPILKKFTDFHEDYLFLLDLIIKAEAKEFGNYHWSNNKRFSLVKESMQKKPVVHVLANITNSGFTRALSEVSSRFSANISFINFSNIHHWVEPVGMEFVRDWPFKKDVVILHSGYKGTTLGEDPRAQLTNSIDDYIQATSEDPRDIHLRFLEEK